MRTIGILLLITSFFYFNQKTHAQCSLLSCFPQITVPDFPNTIYADGDSMELEVQIATPASCEFGYSGRLEVIKEGGAFGPSRNLDTINVELIPGSTSNYKIKFAKKYFTEGSIYQDEKKAIAISYKGLDFPCNSSLYLDPSPEVYQFYLANCLPLPLIKSKNFTLSSVSTVGNRWYLNGNLLTTETNDTLYFHQIGEYILEVYLNGCHSYDTINIEEVEVQKVNLYPNPVNDFVHLKNYLLNSPVRILNGTGTVIEVYYEDKIDVWDLPNGIYIVEFYSTDNKVNHLRFIKDSIGK
jgi:hypothetical protein